jgi:hypothetical protein
MDMQDVAIYHSDEKKELVVHIKNIESKIWCDTENQLLEGLLLWHNQSLLRIDLEPYIKPNFLVP